MEVGRRQGPQENRNRKKLRQRLEPREMTSSEILRLANLVAEAGEIDAPSSFSSRHSAEERGESGKTFDEITEEVIHTASKQPKFVLVA